MWNIISFETLRALKKKSFWIASIAPLIFILVVLGVEYISTKSAESNAAQQAQTFSATAKIGEFDDSGLISQQLLAAQHITIEPSKDAGIAAVKDGELDAFFYYPTDPSTMDVEVYAQDQGISLSPPYNAAASQLLHQSAISDVGAVTNNSHVVQVLENAPSVTATTYKVGVAALSFSGSQYALTNQTGLPLSSNSRTTSLWFKLNATGQTTKEMAGYGQNNNAQRWGVWLSSGDAGCLGTEIGLEMDGYGDFVPWTQDTNWHNLAITLPSGASNINQALIYFDGVLQTACYSSSQAINTTNDNEFAFATIPTAHVDDVNAVLGDVRVYSRALSATQVAAMYNGGK